MPISRALGRIADHWAGRKVTLRFTADYRIACFSLPLIKRLLANTADGETYRCSIAEWPVNERPPLYVHRGVVSTLRVDGRSEEHTSELQSLMRISYAVFCLKKKTHINIQLVTLT